MWESVTCVATSSSRTYGFKEGELLPHSAVWIISQRLSAIAPLSNGVNTHLHDQMHYGTRMAITSSDHGGLSSMDLWTVMTELQVGSQSHYPLSDYPPSDYRDEGINE